MTNFDEMLASLKEKNLLREISGREGRQGRIIKLHGRELLNFASNDYLGLAGHPLVIAGAKAALEAYGAGSGASRLLAGGSMLHGDLESRLAEFKGAGGALLFGSGYGLNAGVIPALAGQEDAIFSDELNHASIIDGSRLSRARTFVYRHTDIGHLKELLGSCNARRKLIVTDSVFSMDGDIAPLKDICALLPDDAILYVDDAHGTGVLGGGKGALEHFGIKPSRSIIQMGTLSKAFGSYGAFVVAEASAIEWLINSARSLIYSTALPPSCVGASIAALDIIKKNGSLIDKLWSNRAMLASELQSIGFDIGNSQTQIVPVMLGTVEEAVAMSKRLFEAGIYAPAIRPPTVERPRIRLSVTAAHTESDISRLASTLSGVKRGS